MSNYYDVTWCSSILLTSPIKQNINFNVLSFWLASDFCVRGVVGGGGCFGCCVGWYFLCDLIVWCACCRCDCVICVVGVWCVSVWFQGLGIHKLRQSRGAGELNRCLLLCLHETDTVTSPSLDDLTCCTCAILHSLLSHFTAAAHDSNCSMCLQLFTLVHFHVQECLAGRRDREEGEGDLSRNVCHKMRQAGMFANNAVTVSSTKVPDHVG